MSVTFAVLALPVFALAAKLEWYGPSSGSSLWLRGVLWLCWLALSVAAIAVAIKESAS